MENEVLFQEDSATDSGSVTSQHAATATSSIQTGVLLVWAPADWTLLVMGSDKRMRRQVMALAILLAAGVSGLVAGQPKPGLTNLLTAMQQAVEVAVPATSGVTNLEWLNGRWECVERALRAPPFDHCRYAFVDTIRFNAEDLDCVVARTGTIQFITECTFVPNSRGDICGRSIKGIEFSQRGFLFDLPDPDYLRLKAPAVARPDWIILEHQDNGDVLCFRRTPDTTDEAVDIGPKSVAYVWGLGDSPVASTPAQVTNAAIVAGGRAYVLALLRDGSVQAWGTNEAGVLDVPAGLGRAKAIAAGDSHCVAVTQEGRVVEWGRTPWRAKETQRIGSLSNIVAVSAGLESTLALRQDGTVVGWRTDLFGEQMTPMPANLTNVTAIASGYFHHLALKKDGTVVAWGLGTKDYGGAGYEAGQCVVPCSATNVVAIAAGGLLSLALNREGQLIVWGGVTEFGQRTVPANCVDVTAIACGYMHCVALKQDGSVVVWGPGAETGMPAALRNVRLIGAGLGFTIAVTLAD